MFRHTEGQNQSFKLTSTHANKFRVTVAQLADIRLFRLTLEQIKAPLTETSTNSSDIFSVKTLRTFHDGDRVLHLRPEDVWSKHSGEVLDAHLVLVAVRLDFVEES